MCACREESVSVFCGSIESRFSDRSSTTNRDAWGAELTCVESVMNFSGDAAGAAVMAETEAIAEGMGVGCEGEWANMLTRRELWQLLVSGAGLQSTRLEVLVPPPHPLPHPRHSPQPHPALISSSLASSHRHVAILSFCECIRLEDLRKLYEFSCFASSRLAASQQHSAPFPASPCKPHSLRRIENAACVHTINAVTAPTTIQQHSDTQSSLDNKSAQSTSRTAVVTASSQHRLCTRSALTASSPSINCTAATKPTTTNATSFRLNPADRHHQTRIRTSARTRLRVSPGRTRVSVTRRTATRGQLQ